MCTHLIKSELSSQCKIQNMPKCNVKFTSFTVLCYFTGIRKEAKFSCGLQQNIYFCQMYLFSLQSKFQVKFLVWIVFLAGKICSLLFGTICTNTSLVDSLLSNCLVFLCFPLVVLMHFICIWHYQMSSDVIDVTKCEFLR